MTKIKKNPFVFDPGEITSGDVPAVDFHIHTSWTDGKQSVAVMYERAIALGLKGLLYSEHARKTSHDWFPDFAAEVRALPHRPCRAYVGVECKVNDFDGNVDTSEEITKHCDMVMASVHRFPAENGAPIPFDEVDTETAVDMEFRLSWEVLANPVIDILGHPFGMSYRRYGQVPSEDRITALMGRAAAFGVAFDINSHYHPDPWRMLAMCREAGTSVTLGSNAHSVDELGAIIRALEGS